MNGWLLLDKPVGLGSTQAVSIIKNILKQNGYNKIKVGHAGTLDPMASGLLLISIGEATKTSQLAIEKDKAYEFAIKWGEERSTLDAEGEVVKKNGLFPQRIDLENCLKEFTGEIEQMPPKYSAIHVNGKRAYDLARQGVEFELKSRVVSIYDLKLISHSDAESKLYVHCSKGFYIRSLARDIAAKLEVLGYVSYLRRLSIKKFLVSDAISLAFIIQMRNNGAHNVELLDIIKQHLKPIDIVLDDILVHEVDDLEAGKLRKGQSLFCGVHLQENSILAMKCEGVLVAFCKVEAGTANPFRVFNL